MLLPGAPTRAGGTATLRPWADGPRPTFALERLSGGVLDLATLRGRVVLVHFFATWCEPCRAEMASLRTLADDHAGQPLAIVAVNVAEVVPRLQRFFASAPVSFPILLDGDRAVTRAWKVDALPTTVVLDPTLAPTLVVHGDLDWGRADVRAALRARLPATPRE